MTKDLPFTRTLFKKLCRNVSNPDIMLTQFSDTTHAQRNTLSLFLCHFGKETLCSSTIDMQRSSYGVCQMGDARFTFMPSLANERDTDCRNHGREQMRCDLEGFPSYQPACKTSPRW